MEDYIKVAGVCTSQKVITRESKVYFEYILFQRYEFMQGERGGNKLHIRRLLAGGF
jgi:hypothetical protein